MNPLDELECRETRAALSARLDGELTNGRDLSIHLVHCGSCRDFEVSLSSFSAGWVELRGSAPPATLWSRIQARSDARTVRRPPKLAWRLAAGLVGFAGVGGAGWWLDRNVSPPDSRAHWAESLTPITRTPETSALFASLPEYQLLVGFPRKENER